METASGLDPSPIPTRDSTLRAGKRRLWGDVWRPFPLLVSRFGKAKTVPIFPLTRTAVLLRPLLKVFAPLSVVGLLAGFAARQPALVALSAPATAFIMVALIRRVFATGSFSFPDVGLELSSARVSAGDEVEVAVSLRSSVDIHRGDVAIMLPTGVEVIDGSAAFAMSLTAGELFVHRFLARTSLPGLAIFGPVVVRIDDRSGLFRAEQLCKGPVALKVVARPDVLQTLLRAAVTGMHVGEQISQFRGDGFEFADMRAYVAGDSAKRIHWRASARTDDPVVIERRSDRNQDVLIVLDAHVNLELSSGGSSLARAMEACVTIAGAHLGARDRVGFVGLGSVVSWIVPGTGHMQKYRILDAIASVSTTGEGIGRQVSAVRSAARPRRSLVIVVTSLTDDRSTEMIRDLQAKRHDVCVVVVAPFDFVADTSFGRADRTLALRLWRLLHEQECRKLAAHGTPIVLWASDKPVELAVREVMAWRQKLRVGRRQPV